jgi:GNAT superfamily N-acetyltransferase
VRDLGIGWTTHVAVLTFSGSSVDDHGDHLVVRTPANPTYHWGNCILVTDPTAADDADRWLQVFGAMFPSATWVAIGLPRLPDDRRAWSACELDLEVDEVLVASTLPDQTTRPDGFTVRRLTGDDWEQDVALTIAENERTRDGETDAYTAFARRQTEAKRAISARDDAAYFGAFAHGLLVASLGIVRCGTTGRYQNVLTDASYRQRGLASHLLGVAARWAASHGCDCWVIVTEATNPAGRVYQRIGLEPHSTNVQAYRRPPS